MGYLLLAVLCLGIAIAIGYGAFRLLIQGSWFLGWLRGTFGLLLVAGMTVLGFMALDVYSYKQLQAEQNVATISFRQLDSQHFSATFVKTDGNPQIFELHGDQWQLDSRIIKWQGLIARAGMKTGYRLDRISGRYLSLDDERNKPRSVYELTTSPAGIDVWRWVKSTDSSAIVDARYGNSTFLPMVEGGQYQISVTTSGLLARPLNQPARDAVDQWR